MTPAERVQSVLLAMADTLPIWRDAAVAILAGLVILGLYLWMESTR